MATYSNNRAYVPFFRVKTVEKEQLSQMRRQLEEVQTRQMSRPQNFFRHLRSTGYCKSIQPSYFCIA